MAMPSAEVMGQWAESGTVTEILSWAGLDETIQATLLAELGADANDSISDLAMTTKAELEEVMSKKDELGGSLPVAAKARIRRAFKAIKMATGTEDEPQAPSIPTPPLMIPISVPKSDDDDAVPLNGVIIQKGDVKVTALTTEEINQAFRDYRKRRGGDPPEAKEPTNDQITAFWHLINKRKDIFVDLAVFTPDGEKMAKFIRMHGARLGPDGKLIPLEVYGPPNIKEWRRCYAIFRTCCIMFDIISAEMLDQYADMIEEMADRYGLAAWPLIYQVEVRTRQFQTHRIRRRLADEKTEALKRNLDHPYNPLQPWEEVWKQLINAEEKWWRKEMYEPGSFVRTGAAKMTEYVDQYAPVSGAGASSSTTRPPTAAAVVASPAPAPPKPAAPAAERAKRTANNSQTPLCEGFNLGSCSVLGHGSRCAQDGLSAHQCWFCLSNTHGGHACPNKAKAAPKKKQRRR